MTARTVHCVLIAVCGTSPAVITETVQAIYQNFPKFMIDEVVVLTTTIGRERLVSQILESGAWEKLREELHAADDELRFGDCADSIQLIPTFDKKSNLADINTPNDHLSMANQLCRILRGYTDNPDITVLASLAGGRKTMSTMMGFCFSLFAREQDKLFHVLVNEPFDGRLEPAFLFKPKKSVEHKLPDGKMISSDEAHIDLIEIPCVHLRKLFPQQFGKAPGEYSNLVHEADYIAGMGDRELRFDLTTGNVTIGSETVISGDKSPTVFWVYWSVARASKEDVPLKTLDKLCEYVKSQHDFYENDKRVCRTLRNACECNRSNISKTMSKLKQTLGEQRPQYFIGKKRLDSYRLSIPANLIVLDGLTVEER
ncbi:MAG: TIGR02584 family CRISPR-associated protein [Victivallales bacterium]|nr:TIGR02584 family CRISPR-associated protein [Victivallales bacterium]